MSTRKLLNKYKIFVTALGLEQLDVYRVVKDGKPVDILRILDPSTGKIVMIDLGVSRESLGEEEFLKKLLEELEKNGITVSERILARLRERFF